MPGASNLSTSVALSCALLGLSGCGSGSSLASLPTTLGGDGTLADAADASASTTAMASQRTGDSTGGAPSSAGPSLAQLTPGQGAQLGVSEIPSQAEAFVNSVGVNTHFVYSNQAYTTQFLGVRDLLINSGIKHIRDSGPVYDQTFARKMATLSSYGIHHSVGMPIDSTPAQITATLNTFGPSNVDFIEPQNEYDTYAKQDPHWVAHIIAEQKTIWKTVRSNGAFNGIAVLGPGLASHNAYALLGPLDSYEDAGNLHAGFCNYNPGTNNGTVNLPRTTAAIRKSTRTKPIWTTEIGYDDDSNLTHVCTTPDATVARYDPRMLAERWNAGEPRSYIFQLVDKPTRGNPFAYMGLLTVDGTPKPEYTALQSMLKLLADPGAAFRPTALRYAIGGQTKNVHHTLLQKRDGTYVMMLWIEKPRLVSVYDPTQVPVPSQQVSLSVPGMTVATNYTYDTSRWTLSGQRLQIKTGAAVDLTVTDAISFLELK